MILIGFICLGKEFSVEIMLTWRRNFRCHKRLGNSLNDWTTIRFIRNIFHGISATNICKYLHAKFLTSIYGDTRDRNADSFPLGKKKNIQFSIILNIADQNSCSPAV
jgi:hypothetical protein